MVIEQSAIDAIGFVSTVGGIVLAVLALVLSILFYRWADTQAKDSEKTLVELRTATHGLGQVVTTLRDESFSLLKSAYTDMGEIAKFGVQRDPGSSTPQVEPEAAPAVAASPLEETKDKPRRGRITSSQSDEVLQEWASSFGPHFVKRRGSDFSIALKEAQKLIGDAIADLPFGEDLPTSVIVERVAPHGFDEEEVYFALTIMAQINRWRVDD